MAVKNSPFHHPLVATQNQEPWLVFPTGKDFEGWAKEDQVIYNQQRRQSAKYHFYQCVFDFLGGNEIGGDYLEFGCHRVRSFRMALSEARRQNRDDMRFFAFDSFEGLPEAEDTQELSTTAYVKGTLATSEQEFRRLVNEHGIYCDRIETIKGFYNDSLTSELQQKLVDRGVKAAMICIDCDFYESAVPVFKFIEPLLQKGTVIYIDDYYVGYFGSPYEGVGKAFIEFEQRSNEYRFAPYLNMGAFGYSFITCKK